VTTPTPTPTEPGDEQFQANQVYQVSVPFADSSDPRATTTVAKAFTVAPVTSAGENFQLFRRNPVTNRDEQLSNNSLIRRGEGYFLRTLGRGVSIKTPQTDRTRIPTSVVEFEIVLRANPSLPTANSENGYNLIGFPFDPAKFSLSEWQNARVISPNGQVFATLNQAAGAGLVHNQLFRYIPETGQYEAFSTTLVPYQGYYAKTFVDGVRVILKAKQ
jgi:hypothetical protein